MTGDLAELVRDKTYAKVKSGVLKPTLQHGLIAQSMLDRRAERAADRQLAIRLAAMMAGSDAPAAIRIVGPEAPKELTDGIEFDPDDLDPD